MYDDYKIMEQKQFEKMAKEYNSRLKNVVILDNSLQVDNQNNLKQNLQTSKYNNCEKNDKKNN